MFLRLGVGISDKGVGVWLKSNEALVSPLLATGLKEAVLLRVSPMKRTFVLLVLFGTFSVGAWSRKFYEDDPLIREPQPLPVTAKTRKIHDYYDFFWHTLATPGEKHQPRKRVPAQGVNTLGDPFESAWWEPRHYWRRMTIDELLSGPVRDSAPVMNSHWTVVAAKTEGITPGFAILDPKGRRYFIKFDPPTNPEMATGADKIASTIFHALGYHVPANHIVYFRPEMLRLDEHVRVEDRLGRKRRMTEADLAEILARVRREPDGRYRATASLAVAGTPIGPYRYFGTRRDDPNDIVPHEHRRDLRGMHVASAFVDHDDSRAINTFDTLVDGPSGAFIKHYQLDFGSTLGSGTEKANSPRSGGEYLFAWKEASRQFLTFGFYVPRWAKTQFPKLDAVGRFESTIFDADRWVPEYPNPAFLNRLPDDEFWMAKQVVNLRDDEIRAIVGSARYTDRKAAEWIVKCLIERRDKIGRAAFAKVLPIDRFVLQNGRLEWVDLAREYGFGAAPQIRVRWAAFDNERETSEDIPGEKSARLPQMRRDGYWLAILESPERPRQSVRVYVRKRDALVQIVGIDRTW